MQDRLLVLFGSPGVGKNFVGKILRDDFGFYFYDADVDLTPDMRAAVQQQIIFTPQMRKEYFDIVTSNVQRLRKNHPRLVVAQALAKETNRQQLLTSFADAKFILIVADEDNVSTRINHRKDWVTVEYAQKIRTIFEAPQLHHWVLDNNKDRDHVKLQIEKLI